MYFPKINLATCFFLSLFLAIHSEKEDRELLTLSHQDKTFGQRRTVTDTDAVRTSPVQWQKTPQHRKKSKEASSSTLTAKSTRAKNLLTNIRNSSEFRRRVVEQLSVNNSEITIETKPRNVLEDSYLSSKTYTTTDKSFNSESPNEQHKTSTLEDIVPTTETTAKSNDTPSTPSQNDKNLFDMKSKTRQKFNWKRKVRRKAKIRRPGLINGQKEEFKDLEVITHPGHESSESTNEEDDKNKRTNYFSVENNKATTLSLNPLNVGRDTTTPIAYRQDIKTSNEQVTPIPVYKDDRPQEYHKRGNGNLKKTSSYGSDYDFPTEDNPSPEDIKDTEQLLHEFSIVKEEEKTYFANNTNTTEAPFHRTRLIEQSLVDGRRTFPLMRPLIRKPKKIEILAPNPHRNQSIETYVYGRPTVTNSNVDKANNDELEVKKDQISSKGIPVKKTKNIWIRKKPNNVPKLKAEGNKNRSRSHYDRYFSKGENSPFSVSDTSTVTSAVAQEVKNNQDIQPMTENSTLSPTPFHDSSPVISFPIVRDFKKHHSSSFIHFGLRNNFSVPMKRDIQPFKRYKDDIRKPIYDIPIPKLGRKDIKRKGVIKTLNPYDTPLKFDLQPSENKQYYVHIFNRVGEYAKPHIGEVGFGEESAFGENSPANFLTSLRMQWEGNNDRSAKVVTEDYQRIRGSSERENRNSKLKIGGIKLPYFDVKSSESETGIIEHLNRKELIDTIDAEETHQASEGELKVDQNLAVHNVTKRSLRIGGKIIRILPVNSSLVNKPTSKSNISTYGYVIQPFYTRSENLTTLWPDTSLKQFKLKAPIAKNLTLASNDTENRGVSVVTSISVIYNPYEETFEPTPTHLNDSSTFESYYVTDSYDKTLTRNSNPVTTISTVSSSPSPKKNIESKSYRKRKVVGKLMQSSPESYILLTDKKSMKNGKKRKVDRTRRFDLLRLSSTTDQNKAYGKNINLRQSTAVLSNAHQSPSEEYTTELGSILPEDYTENFYQIATPALKPEASESVESFGQTIGDIEFFEEPEEDKNFEPLNPLDKEFYSSVPIVDIFEPTTESVQIKEFEFLDGVGLKNEHKEYEFGNEKKHFEKESEYRKQTQDREKTHLRSQEKKQMELKQKRQLDTVRNPLSDWADYGVFHDSSILTDTPVIEKTPRYQNAYDVDPFPRKTEQIENDITHDSFTNPPEDKKYPTLSHIPKTSFRCKNVKYLGYYADKETNCQVFHLCLENGEKHSFLCPKSSLFNQHLLTCDWWHRVDCKRSGDFYELNIKMYPQRNHFSLSTTHHFKSKGDEFHDDTPRLKIESQKPPNDRKWTIDIKEQKKKNYNSKVVVQPKDRKTFKNDYVTFYERPVLDFKETVTNLQKGDVTTETPIDYSDWLKEKGSVFDATKDSDWEAAVTSDLQKHVEDQIRQKELKSDSYKVPQEKHHQKKKFHNDYQSHQNGPQSSLRHQQRSVKKHPAHDEKETFAPHLLATTPSHTSRPQSVIQSQTVRFKSPREQFVRDHTYGRSVQNTQHQTGIPSKRQEYPSEKQQESRNGFLVFPISPEQSGTASNGKKFDINQKEPLKKGTGKQGFWTSENLRKTKKLLPQATLPVIKAQTRSPDSRMPSSSINRYKSKALPSNRQRGHKNCDHDGKKNSVSSEPKFYDQSPHSKAYYRHSNQVKNLNEGRIKNILREHQQHVKKIPQKIVGIKYTKEGDIKPVNIYLEQEDEPDNFKSEHGVASLRGHRSKNNIRYLNGRLNSKVPELAYINSDGIGSVEIHPVKLFGFNNLNNHKTSGQMPINEKIRSGYNLYYETEPDVKPGALKFPVFRQYNGHQSNSDKMIETEFKKNHPSLFRVTKESLEVRPKYHKHNFRTNKGNIDLRDNQYNHDQTTFNGNVDHSTENVNKSPLHFERKKILNLRPHGYTVKIGPVAHGPIDAKAKKEIRLRPNRFSNDNMYFKSLQNKGNRNHKYGSLMPPERERYSVPYDKSFYLENKKLTKNSKELYNVHTQENNDGFLPLYRENPVEDDIRQIKFHIIRPYGQTVKTGSLSDDHRIDDAKTRVKAYRNRETIPSTKTGRYLETASVQPELNNQSGRPNNFNSPPKGNVYYRSRDSSSHTGDSPIVRKNYFNSKVRFPRLNFKISQIDNPTDHIFPGEPKTLILKTVKTGPVTVEGNVPYNQNSKQYKYHNSNEKSVPLTTGKSSHSNQASPVNPPNSLHHSIEEASYSEENSSDFDSYSEYDPKPFHIVRPYGQTVKTYGEDKSNVKHGNPKSLHYSSSQGQYDDSHLYNDNYSEGKMPFFQNTNYQTPNNVNNQFPHRDISKHVFTPGQDMKYYQDISPDSKGKNRGSKNSHTPSPNIDYNSKPPGTLDIPVTPSITHNENNVPEKYDNIKYDFIPTIINHKPPTISVSYSDDTTESHDFTSHNADFGKTQSPQLPIMQGPTEDYAGVTLSGNYGDTIAPQTDSNFSPSPEFRHPVTTTKFEDYTKLEQVAEKKAEEYVKAMNKRNR